MTDDLKNLIRFAEAMRNAPEVVDRAADEIGKYLVDTIKARVRLGYGVQDHGMKKEKFTPLAPSTVKHRQWLSAHGLLFKGSKPSRSHLTATGQMMDSLIYIKKPGRLILTFNNPFASKKAYYNNSAGRSPRPFFYLTNLELKAINRMLQKALDEYIAGLVGKL